MGSEEKTSILLSVPSVLSVVRYAFNHGLHRMHGVIASVLPVVFTDSKPESILSVHSVLSVVKVSYGTQ
jgi:hypothetical protein